MKEVPGRLYATIGVFALVALAPGPVRAQIGDLVEEMKDAARIEDREEESAKRPDDSAKARVARVKKATIVVDEDRTYAIREKRIQLPWPELEMLEPVGAEVAIYSGKTRVHQDRVPFVFKKAKIGEYLELVVEDSGAAWRVKLKPKKGYRTIIDSSRSKRTPAKATERKTCQSVLIAKGHDSMDLAECKGVNESCAIQLLESGHPPQDLMFCEGVNPSCAVLLLKRGDDPTDLIDCK